MKRINKKNVVIITPLLNEEENILTFYKTTSTVVSKIKNYNFSFLFVDDGSIDKSWNVLETISKHNKNISSIKLSRNFGSHTAIYAGIETGLSKKNAEYFILTTIDLQNPPELISKMIEKIKEDNRVVWGVRTKREEGVNAIFGNIYYWLVKKFALSNMPIGGIDYCLIDKKVATDVINISEKNTSIFGIILWLGYKQEMIPFIRREIKGRKSRWTLTKKMKLLMDTFVSFSYTPIKLVTYIGLITSSIGFLYAFVVVFRRVIFNIQIEGWSSLMFVVLVLFGFNMIMLGIIAEYLWRTFDASRKRPIYLLDKKINI